MAKASSPTKARAHRRHPRFLQHLERVQLATLSQCGFQLIGDVEMVDQRGLAAAGDQAELVDPGGARLVHRVLDQRLVDDREHLLGHRFRGRQEPRAEPGDGQHGFA
jgi:hypothetical protein